MLPPVSTTGAQLGPLRTDQNDSRRLLFRSDGGARELRRPSRSHGSVAPSPLAPPPFPLPPPSPPRDFPSVSLPTHAAPGPRASPQYSSPPTQPLVAGRGKESLPCASLAAAALAGLPQPLSDIFAWPTPARLGTTSSHPLNRIWLWLPRSLPLSVPEPHLAQVSQEPSRPRP